MNEKGRQSRHFSRSVTDTKRSLPTNQQKTEASNAFPLCLALKKLVTVKNYQGFIRILGNTNKSYARSARLRNLAIMLKYKERKNFGLAFKQMKTAITKYKLLLSLIRRSANASNKVKQTVLMLAFAKLRSLKKVNKVQSE